VDCELRHLRNGVRDCRVQNLFVIARTSSFTYKGKAVDVKWVGRELDVRYVLEGSVRKAATAFALPGS
jgi:TolB-like protein